MMLVCFDRLIEYKSSCCKIVNRRPNDKNAILRVVFILMAGGSYAKVLPSSQCSAEKKFKFVRALLMAGVIYNDFNLH